APRAELGDHRLAPARHHQGVLRQVRLAAPRQADHVRRHRRGRAPLQDGRMTTSVPSDTRAATAKQLRRLRARRLGLRLLLGVGVPTLLASIYYGALVQPQYESVTSFTIQSADGAGPGNALQLLVAAVPGTASRDVMLVREYVESRDML